MCAGVLAQHLAANVGVHSSDHLQFLHLQRLGLIVVEDVDQLMLHVIRRQPNFILFVVLQEMDHAASCFLHDPRWYWSKWIWSSDSALLKPHCDVAHPPSFGSSDHASPAAFTSEANFESKNQVLSSNNFVHWLATLSMLRVCRACSLFTTISVLFSHWLATQHMSS